MRVFLSDASNKIRKVRIVNTLELQDEILRIFADNVLIQTFQVLD